MNKTRIILTITHAKPIPEKIEKTLAETIAQRAYSYLYSQGVEVGVDGKLAQIVEVRD